MSFRPARAGRRMRGAPEDLSGSPFGEHSEFRIGLRFLESEVEVEIGGELDLATDEELRPVLSALIDHGWRPRLDLAGLRFIDCSGLSVLRECAMRLQPDRGQVVLRAPSTMLRRILSITRLETLFELEDPPEENLLRAQLSIPPGASLAGDVWRINALPFSNETVDAALRLAVSTAPDSTGADGASVSLFRDGELQTVASTDAAWIELDERQYALAEGPCFEAAMTGHQTLTPSVGNDERWSRFGESAGGAGVEGMLSTPLSSGRTGLGALNLYWRRPESPVDGTEARAQRLADSVSELLDEFGAVSPHDEVVDRVEAALHARENIALAVGVLMEREQVDRDRAFALLGHLAAARDESMRKAAAKVAHSTNKTEGGS